MTAAGVFDSLLVGEIIAEREFHFTRDTLVRYAGASGDFNPIHYRDDIAQSVGLPGVLAHGMLTLGAAGTVVTDWLSASTEAGSARVIDLQARFTRPVLVDAGEGARLTVTATVGAVLTEDRTVRIDLKAVSAGQTVLAKSQALVAFE